MDTTLIARCFFSKAYCNAKVDRIDLTPGALGVKQIGHMGYFRGHVGEKLWPEILQWLAQHGLLLDKRD